MNKQERRRRREEEEDFGHHAVTVRTAWRKSSEKLRWLDELIKDLTTLTVIRDTLYSETKPIIEFLVRREQEPKTSPARKEIFARMADLADSLGSFRASSAMSPLVRSDFGLGEDPLYDKIDELRSEGEQVLARVRALRHALESRSD